MTTFRGPGALWTTELTGATTGEAALWTAALLNADTDAVVIAATNTGVSETSAPSGNYKKTFTLPTTAGTYKAEWVKGSVKVIDDDFVEVTSTAPVASVPSGSDLTTLAAVRAFMQKPAADTDQDTLIQQAITRASAAIMNDVDREFVPQSTGLARKFSYTGGGYLYFGSYDLRAVTLAQIDTDLTPVTLATTDYVLQPLQPREGVYTWMKLPNHAASEWSPREVTITGNWGFPSIPADVEEACILTVIDRLKRDVSGYTQSAYSEDAATILRPISIPLAARRLLDPYRRPLVA